MKTIRLILLLCLFTTGIVQMAPAEKRAQRDSLVALLETLGHDSLRLQTLQRLTKISKSDIEECARYAEQLLQEAELQQDDYYKIQAYIYKIVLTYNSYNRDSTQTLYELIAPLARKEKLYDELFLARRCAIDMQSLGQNYEYSEKEALLMLQEAKELNNMSGQINASISLASIYRITYRQEKAVEILEKARALLPNRRQDGAEGIYQTLTFIYEETHSFKSWLRNLTLWENYIQKYSTPGDPSHLIIYASYLKYYTQTGDWVQAEKYRILGDKSYERISSPLYKIHYLHCCIVYLRQTKQYELALEKSKELVAVTKTVSTGVDYYNSLLIQATQLSLIDRSEQAIPLLKEIINFRDSLQVATINKQYEQLKKDFNAEQLLLEQAQLRHRMQLFTVALLVLGLLVIGYFILHLLRTRKFLAKAESEMREINNQMELANQAKDRFLSNISNSIHIPLNTVVAGSLRLAEQQVENEEERQVLSADIRHKATDLLKMINDILDLSRLEAGMMKFEVGDVEITSSLLDAIGASPAIQHGVEIEPAFAMDTLYMTRMDGNRLLQVFKSLFEDKAPECSRIKATSCEVNPDRLEITVLGTVLARSTPQQDVIIRNEINRMLIHHFEGTYEICQIDATPAIRIALPVTEIIRPDNEPENQSKIS